MITLITNKTQHLFHHTNCNFDNTRNNNNYSQTNPSFGNEYVRIQNTTHHHQICNNQLSNHSNTLSNNNVVSNKYNFPDTCFEANTNVFGSNGNNKNTVNVK